MFPILFLFFLSHHIFYCKIIVSIEAFDQRPGNTEACLEAVRGLSQGAYQMLCDRAICMSSEANLLHSLF